MKKIIIILVAILASLNAWETTTHRAIDQEARKHSSNLASFVNSTGIKNTNYKNETFEGYTNKQTSRAITYFDYFNKDYSNDGMVKWKQTFHNNHNYQDLIEAGSMLEDAVWQDEDVLVLGGDGRFNNHFYESQNGGKKLTWGYGFHVNAVEWATDVNVPTANPNLYNYPRAMRYFKLGFTESDPAERRKYQAKMLVSVGHLMHLVNDMNVPAHVRDDAHPFVRPLETWMRGGEDGSNKLMGFHVMGSEIKGNISKNMGTIHKQSSVADFMKSEAEFTSKNFLTQDTLYMDSDSYLPNKSTISYTPYFTEDGVKKRYIRNRYKTKIAMEIDSYLCNKIRLYYPTGPKIGLCGTPTTLKGDYSVLEDSGEVLIKRAMSNATGFLDYFFRGQISAKIDGSNITIKNISDPSLVKDGSTITIYPGAFHLKYTTRYDNTLQDFVFVRDMDRAVSNIVSIGGGPLANRRTGGFVSTVTLTPGESIVVAIERDTSILDKNIVVVYDGQIGSERGISVCAASTKLLVTGTRE